MSRPQEPQRPLFPFGNPFRMILPKGSHLSPRLIALLNNFEEALAERLRKLKPKNREDVLTLSWVRDAMHSLCAIHTDIKTLITALELPVSDWDDKWIDVYLDNSVKMLDICIGFSAEISRLKQGHLFLQCVRNLDSMPSKQFIRARSSLDDWKHHITLKNSRIENCFNILDNLVATLNEPKVKNSSKGKVLMRAMYGVKVLTVFVCRIFAAAFSGSSKKLMDLHVPEKYLWAEAFTSLQAFVNGEIRNVYSSGGGVSVLKELQVVNVVVKKMYPLVEDGPNSAEAEEYKNCISDLGKSAANFSEGLDNLLKEVDGFFQILLSGRDALLCNLRAGTDVSIPVHRNSNPEQVVR